MIADEERTKLYANLKEVLADMTQYGVNNVKQYPIIATNCAYELRFKYIDENKNRLGAEQAEINGIKLEKDLYLRNFKLVE